MADDWEPTLLGELVDITHGFAFQGEFFRDEPAEDVLLTPGNFAIGGGFKTDKLKYYSGPVPDDFVLNGGDLVVSMTDLSRGTDTLGYPAIVPHPGPGRRFLHNQRLGRVAIQPDAPLEKRFLYYVLCSREYRDEVVASATGTTVKHTSPSRIKRYRFLRPSRSEQRAIAHILGTLDDKIELNRQMNEALEATARALFKSWFVEFDPVHAKAEGRDPGLPKPLADLFPDSLDGTALAEIPTGWGVSSLRHEFDVTMGQSPPGETYNEIGNGLPFYQGRADFGFRFPARRIYCTAPTRVAREGDTLVSVRAPVGDVNMAAEKCSLGRGVASVRHKGGFRSFTFYSMRALRDTFVMFEAEGTVFGAINKGDFANISVVAPPQQLISGFERLAAPLDQAIWTNETQAQTLGALRDALLPKLISGELRVKAAERIVADVV